MAAHRLWTQAIFADNYSPMQSLANECFEDARMGLLTMRKYPGMRKVLQALHPKPTQGACNPQTHCCFRHRLASKSHALLSPDYRYTDSVLMAFVSRFLNELAHNESSTLDMAALAVTCVGKTRLKSDQLPTTYFEETDVYFRDDNHHLWHFHDESDDEDFFNTPHASDCAQEPQPLHHRHCDEWNYASKTYRPDCVCLFEKLHPAGTAAMVDQVLTNTVHWPSNSHAF